ncbi:hypothetical protein BT96DRAFT_1008711 [Gymnopus androsaceus JB14]|uniref:Uncharacterized protein n=1 Tax=Gymnopus androsaceus JB14 TaxID=1447944 RepID=A0A6A4GEI3_9AGAR|nr:hypothetical protein BT96DRAFT_1008711 [Gymnopus androsaceus JB14]
MDRHHPMRNTLLALKTWDSEGSQDSEGSNHGLAFYFLPTLVSPRDAAGVLVPALNILDHVNLQCQHLRPPRIFTDPDVPEQVYAVCASRGATRCDYFICVSDIYLRIFLLGDRLHSHPEFFNHDLLALRTWHLDGEYLAIYPKNADGVPVPPLNILAHEDLQCEHIWPPRIFTDPDFPEQVYAVCASHRATRCDYLICISDIHLRASIFGDLLSF